MIDEHDDKDFLGNPCKSEYENEGGTSQRFKVETPCYYEYKFDSLLYARWNEGKLSKTPEGLAKCVEKSIQVWNEGKGKKCAFWRSSTCGETQPKPPNNTKFEYIYYEEYIC